jgi:Ni/Fe-hydrogenase subunit HybB-like protein
MLKNLRIRFPSIKLPSVKLTPWVVWLALLSLLMLAALVSGILVFRNGLWITNLTDLVPWGLWITIDISSIALSAGAFTLCAAVYLVGLKRYQPIARTATFVGLIGYTMAMLSLLLDIGRPDRFWHAIIYWNEHSLLWEVTMCVVLYLTVLVFEAMPILTNFEWLKKRFPKLASKMSQAHHYAPYLAIAGLCLSMLHQSSLGAVYGVIKARPFWYKPEMAVLFMASAIVGGISLTLFASLLAARLTPKARINDVLVERVSHFVAWALVGYLYFRFWDVLAQNYTYQPGRTEGLKLLTSGPLSFNFWVIEVLLGMVIPMIMLLTPTIRRQPFWRMVALGLVVCGVIAYRWDTNISGLMVVISYLPGATAIAYTSYQPSLVEIISGIGILAYGLMAYSLGVRYLRVVDHRYAEEEFEPVKVQAAERVPAQP